MPASPFGPQAENDLFSLFEGSSLSTIVSLNVMSNDKGGAAKSLYSVEDANPNDLRVADVVNGVSPWEPTAGGNAVRILEGS